MRLHLVALLLVGCSSSAGGDTDDSTTRDGDGSGTTEETVGTQGETVVFEPVVPFSFPLSQLTVTGPDEAFATANGMILRLTDGGSKREARAFVGLVRRLAADRSGTLYINVNGFLSRSNDGGVNFTRLTVPPALSGSSAMHVTSDGALWMLPHALISSHIFRSTDHGDRFDELPLPSTVEGAAMHEARDGFLYFVADSQDGDQLYRTRDGTAWELLGTYSQVLRVYATAAGTIFVGVRDAEGTAQLRSTDGGLEWDRHPDLNYYIYRERPGGGLVRLSSAGLVDESDDEGLGWTPLVDTSPGYLITGMVALDGGLIGEGVGGLALLRTGATQWARTEPVPLPTASIADYRDIAFSAGGRIALAGKRQVFVSTDNGAHWQHGFTFEDTFPVNAIAYRPDGERIFCGSTLGRYAVLDGLGAERLTADEIEGEVEQARETIRQALWFGGETTPLNQTYIVVSTASDDNLKGKVWQRVLTDEPTTRWIEVNPFDDVAVPNQKRRAGYYGLGITKPDRSGESWYVGAREYLGINATQDHLRVRYADGWTNGGDPVAYGQALTISASGPYGRTVAYLFSENRIYMGGFTNALLPATLVGATGDVLSAKFAPDGKLWLVTSHGHFRSQAAYGQL